LENWKLSHCPFHWFVEFYGIISRGGFDVIIGNPPYVEYSKVKKDYEVYNIQCLNSGNLYAFIIEQTLTIQKNNGRNGMIIQLSGFCTPRMQSFQELWLQKANYSSIAFFDDRPGKLFDGLQHIRVAICTLKKRTNNNKDKYISTTNYIKFYSEARNIVFNTLTYINNNNSRQGTSILKVNNIIEHNIINKIWSKTNTIQNYVSNVINNNYVYYGYGYGYFGKILNYKSYFESDKVKESTGDKYIYIKDEYDKDIFVALLNSTLFYWFYVNYSDGHNFTKTVIQSLPFEYPKNNIQSRLKKMVNLLMIDLQTNSFRRECNYKTTGKVIYDEYYPKLSKPIIDEIDKILAEHYGFTEEELDFIINYDIK
ncbi:MAG: Eco57I restriction-modification methylase domain-containing protein, partial [Dolichospermum sp.]